MNSAVPETPQSQTSEEITVEEIVRGCIDFDQEFENELIKMSPGAIEKKKKIQCAFQNGMFEDAKEVYTRYINKKVDIRVRSLLNPSEGVSALYWYYISYC